MDGQLHGEPDEFAKLAKLLVDRGDVDRELEREALAELQREGRVTYTGAARRRQMRERALATEHARLLATHRAPL